MPAGLVGISLYVIIIAAFNCMAFLSLDGSSAKGDAVRSSLSLHAWIYNN